ncbi:MAG: hypothetical protein CVU98_09495 [Firmicutes bacterium HGW-Firmicutes-3]|jgi:uncharacterized membrane protein|nr:MAG: hypothetical protein CVU98_09495 [Firmicutes bacterium HGW-Firmicutes-3]
MIIMKNTTKTLTYSGLMAALTFISTSILSFPSPFTGGYIHIGDALVLSCGVVLGKRNGALAAGIGSALADIYLGYASWALPTFIIKALMAYVIGYMFEDLTNLKKTGFITFFYSFLWVGFGFLVRGLIASNRIIDATQDLIADEVIANETELISTVLSTQNIILAIALLLPLALMVVFGISRFKPSIAMHFNKISAFIVAGSVMVILYYVTYGIMYGNWIIPVFSIPANMVQFAFGLTLATLMLPITLRFQLSKELE